MRGTQRDTEFVDFVTAQRTALLRMARLLTAGDDAHAEDLVQTTLTKLYVHWPRVRRAGNPVGYARTSLTHAFVDEQRRAHRRRETPTAELRRPARRTRRTGPRPRRPGRTGQPGPAAAGGRRAAALPRPRRRRDRPGPLLLHRNRQVAERQGTRPAPHHPRSHHHHPGAPMNDLNTLLDRAAGPTVAPLDVHADLSRGRLALARTRRRRGAAGLLGVAAAGVVGFGVIRYADSGSPQPVRAVETTDPETDDGRWSRAARAALRGRPVHLRRDSRGVGGPGRRPARR